MTRTAACRLDVAWQPPLSGSTIGCKSPSGCTGRALLQTTYGHALSHSFAVIVSLAGAIAMG
jgi:hypothetical protein